jgi:uncharacterized hydrophobic protein (TIGR00271 family)
MKELVAALKRFARDLFNLEEDKADEEEIVESIRKNVHFRGTNLWTLIFAIFIASIGLNVNSPAVIIGAMLISPLMGPIMGIGLGIGIYDSALIKKGIKNLVIAAVISILASCSYFLVTPLHEAKSELLARTSPSIWDVFIAFFGGLAGIVAGTRKRTGIVLPGVAIATALMPPLCTAGFGLATAQWYYFLGALYLFFINSLFICIATVIIVRYLGFRTIEFPTSGIKKRVARSILILVMLTVLPSIYLAWRIVKRTIFEENAKTYILHEFNFPGTQVVNRLLKSDAPRPAIELLLIGEELSAAKIDSLRSRLGAYNLRGTELIIRQGLDAKQQIDLAQIRASILEDVFAKRTDTIAIESNELDKPLPDLKGEVRALYPNMRNYILTRSVTYTLDSMRTDTITLFVADFDRRPPARDVRTLKEWLSQRLRPDSVKLVIE